MSQTEKVIFIIDDTRIYNSFMRIQLKQLGYQVTTFEQPQLAIKELATTDPYLIILDHNIDRDDSKTGLYYLEQIKGIKQQIPVLYVTGENNQDLAKQAEEKGAMKLIVKSPTILEEIKIAIDEIENPSKPKGFFSKLFPGRS